MTTLLSLMTSILLILILTLLGRIVRWIIERKDQKQDHNGVWDMIDDDGVVMRIIIYFTIGLVVVAGIPLFIWLMIKIGGDIVKWVSNIMIG